MVEIYKRREELGLTLRMTVHDELDADLADPRLLPQVEQAFNTQYIPLKVPILWSAEIGPSWGEAKGKA
jgi:DNA polymerase I-like protein with 3'-5' exonuclease and polymerase domains